MHITIFVLKLHIADITSSCYKSIRNQTIELFLGECIHTIAIHKKRFIWEDCIWQIVLNGTLHVNFCRLGLCMKYIKKQIFFLSNFYIFLIFFSNHRALDKNPSLKYEQKYVAMCNQFGKKDFPLWKHLLPSSKINLFSWKYLEACFTSWTTGFFLLQFKNHRPFYQNQQINLWEKLYLSIAFGFIIQSYVQGSLISYIKNNHVFGNLTHNV